MKIKRRFGRFRPLLRVFIERLIRYRTLLLAVSVVLTMLAIPIARELAYDQSIESLYALDDPQLQDFQESKSLFGGDEFVIVAWEESNLFEKDSATLSTEGEAHVRAFAEKLNTVPGVMPESTQHLAEALRFKFGRKYVRRMVEDFLVGSDNVTTAVVLRLLPEEKTSASRESTIAQIREMAATHDPPAFVVGEPVQIHDMFRIVEEDAGLLFVVSLGVLAIVIFIMFRSLRWVLLPLAVVVITIVWTEAILVLSRTRLSMVSSMLNAMVTIIGTATVTHITVHFLHARRTHDRVTAFRKTFVELLPAVFWTCVTTAIGFAALLSSQITPVRSFGIMMTLASLLILVVTACVIPAGVLIGNRELIPVVARTRSRLDRILDTVAGWIVKYPKRLAFFGFVSLLLTIPGLFLLKVETDFSRNFRESSAIVRGLQFVETRLGGAGSWEVNFPAPAELTPEFLERVERVTANLRELEDDTGRPALQVVSLTDGLRMVPRMPFVSPTLKKRLTLLRGFQKEFVPSLYNPEEGRMRIMLRGHERQPSEAKLALIEEAGRLTRNEFGEEAGAEEAGATGIFVLLAFIIQSLLSDQLVSFGWAAVGIVTMMTIAFGSFRIGMISLVPNIFPIVIVIGSMGWMGVPVNIGTAMIASVSMGLSVDSTIHYISAFQRERQKHDIVESLRRTHQGVGRALIFAYLALIVGFAVLTLSQFIPLVYFGVLLSLAMVGGLVGDLILLPVLLRWVETGRARRVAARAAVKALAEKSSVA